MEECMSYECILYDVADRVATITLNNLLHMNAFGRDMEREMRQAMVGADMSRQQSLSDAGRKSQENAPPPVADGIEANYVRRLSYLLRIPKPIIAAVNGSMAGMGMTQYCDMSYMADSAKLYTAFVNRGLVAEHGASWLLPRLIGPMNALDLLLTGREIDGAEAARLGLVRALPEQGFMDQVRRVAVELAASSSPRSTAIIKRQVYDALMQSLGEALVVAEAEEKLSFTCADFKEGVAHYIEKRAPVFTGR